MYEARVHLNMYGVKRLIYVHLFYIKSGIYLEVQGLIVSPYDVHGRTMV
jgi:hypothetical protein